MTNGYEVSVPFKPRGTTFYAWVLPEWSIQETIDFLRRDDPVWRQKPRIRVMTEDRLSVYKVEQKPRFPKIIVEKTIQ